VRRERGLLGGLSLSVRGTTGIAVGTRRGESEVGKREGFEAPRRKIMINPRRGAATSSKTGFECERI